MQGKRVVITGGCGFIGSHIVEKLCEDNEVIIIDNSSKNDNIRDLLDKVKLVNGDILKMDLKEIFQGVDYVFHEAATTSVQKSIEDPASTIEINTGGTIKVLVAARDCRVKKVIYASSASVYGDSAELPKREDMATNPKSPYAVSKLSGEQCCRLFTNVYGLNTAVLRYFNVFGPRQDPKSEYAAVIPRFITTILSGKKPVIFGDGTQTRDFVFVDNIVDANILAASSDTTEVINIGSGTGTSINELVKRINDITGNNIEPEYEKERKGDIKHSVADITNAKKIGYTPGKMEEGLKETIEWFNKS